MQAAISQISVIFCPSCTKGRLELPVHERSSGWRCGECGRSWKIKGRSETAFELEEEEAERQVPTTTFLRLDVPLILCVSTFEYKHAREKSDQERHGNSAYFYAEHTCPINWARDITVLVGNGGDIDPHGAVTYLGWKYGHVDRQAEAIDAIAQDVRWADGFSPIGQLPGGQ